MLTKKKLAHFAGVKNSRVGVYNFTRRRDDDDEQGNVNEKPPEERNTPRR